MRFFLKYLIIAIIPVCTLANNQSELGLNGPSRVFTNNNKIKPEFKKPLFRDISLDSFNIEMEKTTLDDIRSKFGGEINHHGDAGESEYWICYIKNPNVFWFISDGEMGGADHSLTGIAVGSNTDIERLSSCIVAPELFTDIKFDIPNVGDKKNSIEKKFKGLKTAKQNKFTITSIFPYSENKEFSTMHSIYYTLDKDIITKILITQITSN